MAATQNQSAVDGATEPRVLGWVERLQAFQALIAEAAPLERQFHDFLAMASTQFNAAQGVILRAEGDAFVVLAVYGVDVPSRLTVGARLPMAETFAQHVMASGTSLALHRVSADPVFRDHVFLGTRPAVYLASPLRVGDRVFGVISMMAAAPRETPFDPADIAFLELMGQALGNLVERDRLEQERQIADRQRRQASDLLGIAFASAPIGMALVGIDGRWLQVNRALCRLLGYTEAELLARDFQSVTEPDDLTLDLKQAQALLAGSISEYRLEKRYRHKDGYPIWTELSVALLRDPDGTPRCFVSQIESIDAQKALIAAMERQKAELEAANGKLTLLASIDPLTEVLNRRALRQCLDDLTAEAAALEQPLAFLMVDVDRFKDYNDRYGHLDGDQALRIIAATIKGASRSSDVVGRFGGEEFLVVLPNSDTAAALAVAERIRAHIASCHDMREPTTVSVGVHVLSPRSPRQSVNAAIAQADAALYQAKHLGRNRVELL